MPCCASALLVLALVQPAGRVDVDDAVRAEVARTWSTDAAQVRVAWGRPVPEGAQFQSLSWAQDGAVIYVTVQAGGGKRVLSGVASSRHSVPVAARPLDRGMVLDSADVQWEDRWVAGPPQRSGADVVGFEVRRRLDAGDLLQHPAVAARDVVRSGDDVTVLVQHGRVQLRVSGRAASNAPLHGRVTARLSTGARVRGVVTEPGVISVSEGMEQT